MVAKKKTAIVSGGGSGIGLATARALDASGFEVAITGRNEEKLAQTGLRYAAMDVRDRSSVEEGIAALGPCDIFIANAGAAQTSPALRTDPDLWNAMIAVNMTGVFNCAQATVPTMIERGWGRFIAIASTASIKGYAYSAAYSAAKHGVLGWIRSLAIELAETGVTANAICPGFTATPLVDDAIENLVSKTGRDAAALRAEFAKGNPMKRLVEPEEVANAVVWLAAKEAGAVNGQAIIVDGGETIS